MDEASIFPFKSENTQNVENRVKNTEVPQTCMLFNGHQGANPVAVLSTIKEASALTSVNTFQINSLSLGHIKYNFESMI